MQMFVFIGACNGSLRQQKVEDLSHYVCYPNTHHTNVDITDHNKKKAANEVWQSQLMQII